MRIWTEKYLLVLLDSPIFSFCMHFFFCFRFRRPTDAFCRYLSGSQLTGAIPDSLGQLTKLFYLLVWWLFPFRTIDWFVAVDISLRAHWLVQFLRVWVSSPNFICCMVIWMCVWVAPLIPHCPTTELCTTISWVDRFLPLWARFLTFSICMFAII